MKRSNYLFFLPLLLLCFFLPSPAFFTASVLLFSYSLSPVFSFSFIFSSCLFYFFCCCLIILYLFSLLVCLLAYRFLLVYLFACLLPCVLVYLFVYWLTCLLVCIFVCSFTPLIGCLLPLSLPQLQ